MVPPSGARRGPYGGHHPYTYFLPTTSGRAARAPLVIDGRPSEYAPRDAGRQSSPPELLLGFYRPPDGGPPFGPALVFGGPRVEGVEPLQYASAPLRVHRRAPSCLIHFTLRGASVQHVLSLQRRSSPKDRESPGFTN